MFTELGNPLFLKGATMTVFAMLVQLCLLAQQQQSVGGGALSGGLRGALIGGIVGGLIGAGMWVMKKFKKDPPGGTPPIGG